MTFKVPVAGALQVETPGQSLGMDFIAPILVVLSPMLSTLQCPNFELRFTNKNYSVPLFLISCLELGKQRLSYEARSKVLIPTFANV